MRWTVEKLRISLVVLGIALIFLIVAAFLYARWQVRHIARDLPAKLGIQIQQSTEGFTYSKSDGVRTVFVVHAAKALQYRKGGLAVLHDVRIQFFNPQGGPADTIAGSQFEYDPHNEIVRSVDEAHIDLHTPAGNTPGTPTQQDRTIHLVTHGLIFNEKTRMATTDGLIEFRVPQGNGQAVGATFDSKQNRLLLKSNVELHAQTQKGPAVIHATQATYDQHINQVTMENATYATSAARGSAHKITVVLRSDSSVENLDAQQDVRYQTASGESISANSMTATINNHNHPQVANFQGNVQFQVQQKQASTHGSAAAGQFFFNQQGHLRQAIMDQDVRFQQNVASSTSPEVRDLKAEHLVMNFVTDLAGRAELKSATATGDASFHQAASPRQQAVLNSTPKNKQNVKGDTAQDTTIRAQQLMAQFAPGNQLLQIDGKGNTQLRSVAMNGDINTSSGDTLQILFDAAPPKTHPQGTLMATTTLNTTAIRSAVQQGHVVLQQVTPPATLDTRRQGKTHQNTGSDISIVTADRAEYQGATQLLTLTGGPRFKDSELEMAAQQMRVHRATGDMTATGAVQTTILGTGYAGSILGGGERQHDSGQLAHIVADRAKIDRNTRQATFEGDARLWQGQNVIEAPVIEILQQQQSLLADGNNASSMVHCTFLASPSGKTEGKRSSYPVYVTSEHLLYSDAERKAHFSGHVDIVSQGSQLQSDMADVYLQPSTPGSPDAKSLQRTRDNSPQSAVERIVAQGNVRMVQPGRRGTGAQIVYTASDGRFVLTGSEQAPPRIVDAERGSVTGHALIFESQQNTILVQGGNSATTTETRVKK
ncbi:MAG TPA: LPS export ABC transporter periplasmic protein LptC [Acidobacteriaceae bacterium]|jgi:lipopolysaccharide export system protein LptA|nr:LPS export ABC transporter periplasmic protein LptC [Acidobacteriaceae bacterium]